MKNHCSSISWSCYIRIGNQKDVEVIILYHKLLTVTITEIIDPETNSLFSLYDNIFHP